MTRGASRTLRLFQLGWLLLLLRWACATSPFRKFLWLWRFNFFFNWCFWPRLGRCLLLLWFLFLLFGSHYLL